MGLFTDLIKTSIKVVAAPIYIPLKVVENLKAPSQYNYWYHDSGRQQESDESTSDGE